MSGSSAGVEQQQKNWRSTCVTTMHAQDLQLSVYHGQHRDRAVVPRCKRLYARLAGIFPICADSVEEFVEGE